MAGKEKTFNQCDAGSTNLTSGNSSGSLRAFFSPPSRRIREHASRREDIRQATFKLLGMVCHNSEHHIKLQGENRDLRIKLEAMEARVKHFQEKYRQHVALSNEKDAYYQKRDLSLQKRVSFLQTFAETSMDHAAIQQSLHNCEKLKAENKRLEEKLEEKSVTIKNMIKEHNALMATMQNNIKALEHAKQEEVKVLKARFYQELQIAIKEIEKAATVAVQTVHLAHSDESESDFRSEDEENSKSILNSSWHSPHNFSSSISTGIFWPVRPESKGFTDVCARGNIHKAPSFLSPNMRRKIGINP